MSARTLTTELARCACGQLPCIHKTQAGAYFIYRVSCTLCGVQTAAAESDHEAYAAWNEGDVQSAFPEGGAPRRANPPRQPA